MILPRFHVRFARWLSLGQCLLALLLCVSPVRGDETLRQVQEELRKRNLYFGDIDGRETPQVAAALRRYQERKGFTPTGELDETTLRSLIDEETLRALNLLSARPPASGGATPAQAAPGPAASPWPDITVMRSDEGLRHLPPHASTVVSDDLPTATPAVVPTPTPGPPPAAAVRSRPDLNAVRDFLLRYLHAGQTNDVPGELAFYGDHVDYFNEGVVDRHFIEGDANRYDRRWPQRQFTLLDPLTLSDSPDNDPQKVVVHFRYAFMNKGPRYTVEGKADNAFTLQTAGPESLRIVGMKEQRVRKE